MTLIQVYATLGGDDHCTDLRPIGCSSNQLGGTDTRAEFSLIAEPGVLYKFAVGGNGSYNRPFMTTEILCADTDIRCVAMPTPSFTPFDAADPRIITFTLLKNNFPVANHPIQIHIVGPNQTASPMVVSTNQSGQYELALLPGTKGTDVVTFFGQIADGSSVSTFACRAVHTWYEARCILEQDVDELAVGLSHTTLVTVLVNDEPTPGIPVTFIATDESGAGVASIPGVTNAAGQVEFSYTSAEPGNHQLVVSGAFQETLFECDGQVRWVAPTCSLQPAAVTLSPSEKHTATAEYLIDGQPASGIEVTFRIIDGPNVQRPAEKKFTDSNGIATIVYSNVRDRGEDVLQVTARIAGQELSCEAVVEWRGPPSCNINPPAQELGKGANARVDVSVTNSLGNPAANVQVFFRVLRGPNKGILINDRTLPNGIATFIYGTTNPGRDDIEVTATVDGVMTSCTATVTWTDSSEPIFPGHDGWMLH